MAATAALVELLQQTTGSIVDTLAWILTCALEEGVVGALVQYLAQTGAFFMAEVKITNHTNHDELKNMTFIQMKVALQYIVPFHIKIVNRALDQKPATKYEIEKPV